MSFGHADNLWPCQIFSSLLFHLGDRPLLTFLARIHAQVHFVRHPLKAKQFCRAVARAVKAGQPARSRRQVGSAIAAGSAQLLMLGTPPRQVSTPRARSLDIHPSPVKEVAGRSVGSGCFAPADAGPPRGTPEPATASVHQHSTSAELHPTSTAVPLRRAEDPSIAVDVPASTLRILVVDDIGLNRKARGGAVVDGRCSTTARFHLDSFCRGDRLYCCASTLSASCDCWGCCAHSRRPVRVSLLCPCLLDPQVATSLLKRLGVEVAQTAADGLEAVSAVQSEPTFDIIFMGE